MRQRVSSGNTIRDALVRGVDYVANAVKVTLGPGGRLVVIDRRAFQMSPHATKDGVTVARFCNPTDPEERMGADLAMDAAHKTVTNAGDGTTTATLLVQAMVGGGMQQLAAKHTPAELEKGMKIALAQVSQALTAMARPAEGDMLYHVALISANGDEQIGRLAADAVKRVGKDGVLATEESHSLDTYLDFTDGMLLPEGLRSPAFFNGVDRPECVLNDALVLVYEEPLVYAKPLQNLLKLVFGSPGLGKPLLVIAGDYGPEALAMFAHNRMKNGWPMAVIRASAYGDRRREVLRDIATLTGGKAITADLGFKIENITEDYFGHARRVISTEHKTIIVGGAGNSDAIKLRAEQIRQAITETTDPAQKVLLERRLAGLVGGISVIKVGGATQAEVQEKKDRAEDATFAIKAAADEGIVPGGGLALLLAAEAIIRPNDWDHGVNAGIQVIYDACQAPLYQIAENAGASGKYVVAKIREGLGAEAKTRDFGWGYNAATGVFEPLIEAGVIDPVKVVREALVNAASAATIVLKAEVGLSNELSKEEADDH